MLLKKGFEVDGDQGRKGEKDQGQSAWGCISYSCSIINMCLLKAVNVPSRLYLKNIDKDFNLISQIIIISQTRTEVIARVRLTRPQPVWRRVTFGKNTSVSERLWVYSHEP